MDNESEELIRSWLKVAHKENHSLANRLDAYFRFMALWIAFNAFLTKEYTSKRGDREKVSAFAANNVNASFHKDRLKEGNFYSEAVEYFKKHGVKNMQPNAGPKCEVSSRECFREVMDCVYQVRCNLFHGDKRIDNENDFKHVEAAYTIVHSHMENSFP